MVWVLLLLGVLSVPAQAFQGDYDCDGDVDFDDFFLLVDSFGKEDCDGSVDFADFFILADNFGKKGDPECIGIYSETTYNRLIFDVDSFIGVFSGAGAVFSTFVDDTTQKQEGKYSKESMLSVNEMLGQYGGWFAQWGGIGSSDTKNMLDYVGGNLSFWVKSAVNLEVGIRSGNVVPGTESSKVLLNKYPSFIPGDDWHKVCIPLSDFTGPAPQADLSQVKVFFVVASSTFSGGTNGKPVKIWIDDVRWEKAP